ncbi:DoxX family protein [Corynebacterium sp. CCM 9187]|uniref:DoxX family protein n=1 Tax=Corynebacterium pygosceleis TaxID=2800406 RepID=A0A9Q4GLK0_9CORY|nr:DoxX family protein [Corynebacterium pygosceleis]MCK7638560.1 DoxX family protein [Corynebacterium pygosceleis]MCK7676338.1 DoxX family protein [Corynebacterium pygosceleis]MCL0121503.1 DoxX family protein [Corynebacterium pygosceleis]MCX7445748.1 DoxX family protein [Corynebacterium pygosceleis]MCX7469297.1 DoxX family protein [Corynebacterium pygosceleis]
MTNNMKKMSVNPAAHVKAAKPQFVPAKYDSRSIALDVVSALARLALAAVWLYSGWQKITDPVTTRQAVRAYELFSDDTADLIAVILPIGELILGVFLLIGLFLRFSAFISAVLLLVFIGGISWAWARGLSIDCGCFGGGGGNPETTWWSYLSEILRDVVFLVLSWIVLRWPFRRFALHG